jgi:DHA1 family bicyclomycin/chloramphenicol resistance-like MFS transporter
VASPTDQPLPSGSDGAGRARAAPRGMAMLLAAMAAIGPFSIDTYLPAFPAMAAGLGASQIEVQQTLTFYLIPFAFMMLWHGALSDALGRRRVLLVAYALYAIASALCVFATSIEQLWLGRALQGLSAGAGLVVGRAIVRDVLDGPAAQRLMAHIGILFAIAPAVAPLVGGWILAFAEWHWVFAFLAFYGVTLFVALFIYLPETLPPADRQSLRPASLARGYADILSSTPFLRVSMALAFNFAGFFIYVLSAPVFLIQHMHASEQGFLWLFGPAMIGMMAGNALAARLAGRSSRERPLIIGYGLMIAAALANVVLNLFVPAGLPWSILPIPVYVCGMALTMPGLQLEALNLFPERRGMASSCQGTLQTGINAIAAAAIVPLLWGTTLNLALGMVAFLALGLTAQRLGLRRV